MNSCLYVLLVLCLVIPEPSLSHPSNSFLHTAINSVLGILGLDDSSSPSTEEDQRQEGIEENLFLSRLLSNPNLRASADSCQEEKNPSCDPNSPFRTYDGACNNLKHPTWGSVNDCLVRLLPAHYEGQFGLRKAVDGDELPSPRDLSLNIFIHKKKPLQGVTFFFTAFGQVVAHDQSLSTPPMEDDVNLNCCASTSAENPDCSVIEIKIDDPFYSSYNVTCLHFLRGRKCAACKDTGKRAIANIVTAAIDGNIAYGRSKPEAEKLRANDGTGRLDTRNTTNGELLPVNTNGNVFFCPVTHTNLCFKAGDPRVNQHTFLASLQTILVREHNRIVRQLKLINPHWDDEKLYHTGRRILGAKHQNIVFNEYAPILLGKKYMAKFNLSVKKKGETTRYDPTLRFGSWVESSTGTFRVHAMTSANIGFRSKRFHEMYSNNHPILEGHMSDLLSGSCRVPSQQYNRFQNTDVTDLLYKQSKAKFGLDLVANDIHRGRDHGLPPYLHVLNYCFSKNRNITEFDDLDVVMPQKNIELLKRNYKSPLDIDLYVGVHLENLMEGAILSRTAACIVAGQLYFAKFGDRFYFEHDHEAPSFTAAQRESLKKSTIGRMICDNTGISALQKNPFLFHSDENPILPCNQHPEVDLNLWKEFE